MRISMIYGQGSTFEAAFANLRSQMRESNITEVQAMTSCVTPKPGGVGQEVSIAAAVVISTPR